jgi:hypothetical protein
MNYEIKQSDLQLRLFEWLIRHIQIEHLNGDPKIPIRNCHFEIRN